MAEPAITLDKVPAPLQGESATFAKDIDLFAGWLNRLENPDPILRSESGGKGLKLYDEVDRDAHAGSVLQTRYLAVIGKEWEVLPAERGVQGAGRPKAQTQEQKIADFVRKCFEDCNFDQFRQELLQAILFGFYSGEVLWKVVNGEIVIDRLLAKHPRRFIFTPERELRLLTLTSMIDGEPVPDRKFVTLTYGSSDNPYGKGLGQSLWWPVWFKKNGIKFWVIFSEKFGSPTAVGKYPSGSTPTQKSDLLDAITSIQQETGITIPEGMAIDLLEATRTGTVNTYETLCEYMDKQISKRVLGQTATTEGTPGKLGNEQSQQEVRDDITKADADLLAECLNNTLVKWLVDLNFGPQAAYPKFWIRCEGEEDLKPLADRDKVLVVDIGLPVGKKYFYETYAIPEPEDGEELVSVPKPTPPTPPAGLPPAHPGPGASAPAPEPGMTMPPQFSEAGFTPAQQAVEDLIDRMAQKGEALDPLLKPVLSLVANASDYNEIMEKIYGLYPKLDTSHMEELIRQSLFAADLWGYAQARAGKY